MVSDVWQRAVLRALVFATIIVMSILLWWLILRLFIAAGPLPAPVAPGAIGQSHQVSGIG